MNNDNLKKGIDELKRISLTSDEKKAMFARLSAYAEFHAPKNIPPVRSPWYIEAFQGSYRAAMGSALTVMLVFGSVVYGAENALPGDFLYPIKVNVNESVQGAFLTSLEAKANWESEKFVRRLEEAESLVRMGKLDDKALEEVEARIDEHFAKKDELESKGKKNVARDAAPATLLAPASAPESNTMMMSAKSAVSNQAMETRIMSASDTSTTTQKQERAKSLLETRIEKHSSVLESLKRPESPEQNKKIEALQRKLIEKAEREAINIESRGEAEVKLNKKDSTENKAGVIWTEDNSGNEDEIKKKDKGGKKN